MEVSDILVRIDHLIGEELDPCHGGRVRREELVLEVAEEVDDFGGVVRERARPEEPELAGVVEALELLL